MNVIICDSKNNCRFFSTTFYPFKTLVPINLESYKSTLFTIIIKPLSTINVVRNRSSLFDNDNETIITYYKQFINRYLLFMKRDLVSTDGNILDYDFSEESVWRNFDAFPFRCWSIDLFKLDVQSFSIDNDCFEVKLL